MYSCFNDVELYLPIDDICIWKSDKCTFTNVSVCMVVFFVVCMNVCVCVSASPISVLFANADTISVTAARLHRLQTKNNAFLFSSPIHFDFRKLMLTVLSSTLCSRQHCLSISMQFKWPAVWQGLFPISGNDISFRLHHSSLPAFAFCTSLYILSFSLKLFLPLSLLFHLYLYNTVFWKFINIFPHYAAWISILIIIMKQSC